MICGALEAIAGRDRDTPMYRSPAVAVGGAVVAALFAGPLAPRAPESVRLYSVLRSEAGVDYASAVKAVGPSDAVSGTNRALSHLMHRDGAYLFPLPFDTVHGTYPAGLETAPSARDAADVDVVIVAPEDETAARTDGFVDARSAAGLYVARR